MSEQFSHFCAVCGNRLDLEGSPYLLTTQITPNRIAILHWNSILAGIDGVRAACAPEHALEIVAHWLISGQLDLTFVQTVLDWDRGGSARQSVAPAARSIASYKPIGEIVINRDSVCRLLASDPEALASVLDSLLEALLRDRSLPPAKKPALHYGATRHPSIA